VLKVIRAFLKVGVMEDGLVLPVDEGTPQGGPLSPLLSNIMLDDLDKELTRRGHRFCRYADDCNIYVRSIRAGERVMASVSRFLTQKLRLKVNETKSAVNAGFHSATAAADGVRLHYWINDRAGQPVKLWHGFLSTGYAWRKVAPALTEAGLAVLIPDMRGYGDSDKPDGTKGYDARALAEEGRALVAELGFGRCKPIIHAAHDMGRCPRCSGVPTTRARWLACFISKRPSYYARRCDESSPIRGRQWSAVRCGGGSWPSLRACLNA
jgi:hypothetical protein